MASGQQSTDFGIAGDPEIPGLQRPAAFWFRERRAA
jgi:hypothetical protein